MKGHSRAAMIPSAVIIVLALFAAGCAATAPKAQPLPGPHPMSADTAGLRWYKAQFKLAWPPDTPPQWFLDTLLANEVAAPVLTRHADDIVLWRFHRRARRDAEGHRFSLYFYTSEGPADAILGAIRTNPALARLEAAQIVTSVRASAWSVDGGRRLSTTSDASWSEAMQRAWPHFIDGVSRLWLALVQEAAHTVPLDGSGADTDAWLARYQDIDATVTAIWQEEGRHALLHHLNAVFGYAPIPVVERRMLRF